MSEDQLLLDRITANLGKRGYVVASTSLACDSWCRWNEVDADLLLLDVEPPDRDALEAVQALEHLGWGKDIPVVALCDEMPDDDGSAIRRGVKWVVKPFAVDVLLSTIRVALGDA
ncbi:MAG: hypothetical protein M1565_02200, partial [Actinobacteria bacterium]|nr:hypothetical protein [Actinomycetota bacterium]